MKSQNQNSYNLIQPNFELDNNKIQLVAWHYDWTILGEDKCLLPTQKLNSYFDNKITDKVFRPNRKDEQETLDFRLQQFFLQQLQIRYIS